MSKYLFLVLFLAVTSAPVWADSTDNPEQSMAGEESNDRSTASETKYGKTNGVLGDLPLVFGPKVTLLGGLVPFGVGLEGKWDGRFGLAFNYDFFPEMKFDKASFKASSWNISAQYFPWASAFFVGLGMGGLSGTVSVTDTVGGITDTFTVTISSVMLTPYLGWRWTWDSGFFMGLEAGVQIPTSVSTSMSASSLPAATKKQAQDGSDMLGKLVLPKFAFIQLGYYL